MNIEQLMAEARTLLAKHQAGTLTVAEGERMNAVSAELKAARDAKAAAGPTAEERAKGDELNRFLAGTGRKSGSDDTRLTSASFKSAAGELATKIAGGDRQIATKTATVGNFDGSLIGTPVVELPARVPNVLSALPLTVAVDRFFDVMIQQSRTIRAGVVPEGGLKPESDIAYERRQLQLAVVAHTVSDVDEYVVQDVPLMQSLLNAEMVGGLWRTIEGQVLNGDANAGELPGILNASGIGLVAASAASPMLRLREAIILLESTDQAPGLIVLSRRSGPGSRRPRRPAPGTSSSRGPRSTPPSVVCGACRWPCPP